MRAAMILILALGLTACEPEIPGGEPAAATEPAAETPSDTVATLNGVDLTQPLSLIGTEPFWAIKTTPGSIVFTTPDEQAGRSFMAAPIYLENGAAQLKTGALEASLTPGPCSDGMSDRVYPLTAQVKLDGQTLKGCAMTTAQMETSKP